MLDDTAPKLIMNVARDDGHKALEISWQRYTSTEKLSIMTLYEELATIVKRETQDVLNYLVQTKKAATGLWSAGETISHNLIISVIKRATRHIYIHLYYIYIWAIEKWQKL